MPKLRMLQNSIEYYGFFIEPVFDLMGDVRSLLKLLHTTFSTYGVNLASFRLDGDASEPSSATAVVRLGDRGIYRFNFDQVQATLLNFTTEQLANYFETLQVADEHLRNSISNLSFKTHVFFYSSHSELSEGTSVDFFRQLPNPRNLPVPGEDLGTGFIQNWRDPTVDAKFSLTVDHSLKVKDGVFINYRVIMERDQVDYISLGATAQTLLYKTLANVGLEFEEEVGT